MIVLRDRHLERKINAERKRRGDATLAKTLNDLARERLVEIEQERVKNRPAVETNR
jgi:hypothetical protein